MRGPLQANSQRNQQRQNAAVAKLSRNLCARPKANWLRSQFEIDRRQELDVREESALGLAPSDRSISVND
jgi:hypothetical protein